jgi:serine protease Do
MPVKTHRSDGSILAEPAKRAGSFGRSTLAGGAVALVLAATQAVGIPEAQAKAAAPPPIAAPSRTASFAGLVERVQPAVVAIATSGKSPWGGAVRGREHMIPNLPEGSPLREFFQRFFDQQLAPHGGNGNADKVQAQGSGFIVDPAGYVLTNHHVIDDAQEITVILSDGSRHPAEVKGRDPKTDLALLKIEAAAPLPYVELGDSHSARVGDWVIAVGNPFGLGGTVTAGIISARGRDIHSGPFDDYLQIDAPINRGNSGGPLFDVNGRVIGVNTAIYSPSGGNVGIGFAIPSTLAKTVVEQLREHGRIERGWLGVQIQPVTEEIAESLGVEEGKGALVASVVPDSPAAKAGVRVGDLIVGFNGEALTEFRDLPRRIANAEIGTRATLSVERKSKIRKLPFKIGLMPSEEPQTLASAQGADAQSSSKLGLRLAGLTSEARERYGLSEQAEGVLVVRVEPNSPAARAGIEAGTLIRMVGRQPVATPEDVAARVQEASAEERASVLLLMDDGEQRRFVAVRFAA